MISLDKSQWTASSVISETLTFPLVLRYKVNMTIELKKISHGTLNITEGRRMDI